MLSYHNDHQLKADLLVQLRWHQKHDRFRQKFYWFNGKGCAVGCSLQSLAKIKKIRGIDHTNHELYEALIGVPKWLARAEDYIFERMLPSDAAVWPVDFAEAIPVGVDLSPVWPRFVLWLICNPETGLRNRTSQPDQLEVLSAVVTAYKQWSHGKQLTPNEWYFLRNRSDNILLTCPRDRYVHAAIESITWDEEGIDPSYVLTCMARCAYTSRFDNACAQANALLDILRTS